jgi:heat shock protein HtpX
VHVPWLTVLLLLLAPAVSTLAQLALSRTREYDADLEAAHLLGDPRPLASALRKMERWNDSLKDRLRHLLPGRPLPDPCLLRTHPPTDERVQRLLALAAPPQTSRVPWPTTPPPAELVAERPIRPRMHRNLTWF